VQCFGLSNITVNAWLNHYLEPHQRSEFDAIALDVLVVATVVATQFEDLSVEVVEGWIDPSFEGCELDLVLTGPGVSVPLD
jgi:hypothetical protein